MSDVGTLHRSIGRPQLIDELRQLRPDFALLGVTGMALFGSRARADNRDDSDVDLIVDIEPARKFSLLDLVAVAHVVEDRVGLRANIFLRRSLDACFLEVARREEMAVFGG